MMRDMFLIDGRLTYDPCGIGIHIFGLNQQTLDACGVYCFGKNDYNLPGSVEVFVTCNENSEFSPRSVRRISHLLLEHFGGVA